ncbi:MAG: hypothetical protein ACRELY_11115 [Polyangiaceae bacterium]
MVQRAVRMLACASATLSLLAFLGGTGCTRSCTTRDDCGTDQECLFPIGSCSAQGECQDLSKRGCDFLTELCGCNGTVVYSECAYPGGYASGPTNGSQCSSQGPPEKGPGFANPDASEDARDAELDDGV